MNSLRLQRQKRSLSKIDKILIPFLLLLALGLFYYLLVERVGFFNISSIEVQGAKSYVNETDLKELAKTRAYGKKIFAFDSNDLEKSLSESFQGAREIKVSKRFPSTLAIYVTERSPIAIVHVATSSEEFLVDESGYVLGQIAAGTSNLPKVSYEGNIEVGYFLSSNSVSVYFDLLRALDKEQVAVSSASI